MAAVIYGLCAVMAVICSLLLLRAYAKSGYRMLLWGGLCFVGLTANNVLLIIDKILLPTEIDLTIWRHSVSLLSMLVLLYGLIFDSE